MPEILQDLDLLLRLCVHCEQPYTTSDGRSHYCGTSCATAARRRNGKQRQTRYRDTEPLRERCRQMFKNAILLGKIRRPLRCEGCGEVGETEGHHEDYTKPFYVHWLCRTCHSGLEDGQHFVAAEMR